jgi:hypothetical protein
MRKRMISMLLVGCSALAFVLPSSAWARPSTTVPVLLNGKTYQARVIGDVQHRADGTVAVRGSIGSNTRLGWIASMFNPMRLVSQPANVKVAVGLGRPAIGLQVGGQVYFISADSSSRKGLLSELGATRSESSPFASVYYTYSPEFTRRNMLTYSPAARAFVPVSTNGLISSGGISSFYLSILDGAESAHE